MLVVISIDSLTNVVQGAFFFLSSHRMLSRVFLSCTRDCYFLFSNDLLPNYEGTSLLATIFLHRSINHRWFTFFPICAAPIDCIKMNFSMNTWTTFIKNIISFGISFSRFVTYRFTVKASKWLDLRVIPPFFFNSNMHMHFFQPLFSN